MAVVVDQVETAPRRVENPKRPNVFRRMRKHWADYVYVLPALGVMLLVIGYPIYYTIYLSFFNTPPSLAMSEKLWVGLDNYERILRSENFRDVTKNTAVWTIFSTFFAFVLGLIAALVLNREFIGRGFVRGVLLVPYVISAVAAAYVYDTKRLPIE